jgi:hypothetical protein
MNRTILKLSSSDVKKRGFFSSRKKGTKIDDFEGLIYYIKKITKEKKITLLKDLIDIEKPIAQINGSWLKFLIISGTKYWDINEVQPMPLQFKLQIGGIEKI